jgi:hypothetical protein
MSLLAGLYARARQRSTPKQLLKQTTARLAGPQDCPTPPTEAAPTIEMLVAGHAGVRAC